MALYFASHEQVKLNVVPPTRLKGDGHMRAAAPCLQQLYLESFLWHALAMSVNHRSKFTTTNTSKARCEATVMSNVCCIHVIYNIVRWYVWQCMHAIRSKGLGKKCQSMHHLSRGNSLRCYCYLATNSNWQEAEMQVMGMASQRHLAPSNTMLSKQTLPMSLNRPNVTREPAAA